MPTAPTHAAPATVGTGEDGRRRSGGVVRVLITLLDQGVVSGASFVSGMIVGRFTSQTEYGLYGLGFTVVMITAELQSALISTPQTVFGPRYHGERNRQFQGSMLLKLLLLSLVTSGGLLMAALAASAAGMPDIARVMMALLVGATAMHLGTFARVACFVHLRPAVALLIDTVSCALQLSVLLWLHSADALNASTAWLAVNLTTLPPALAWVLWHGRSMSFSLAGAREDFLTTWQQTRWILASSVLWVLGIQVYAWLIELLANRESVAIWTACFQLSAIGNPLMIGLMNMLGPQITHRHAALPLPKFRVYAWKVMAAFAAVMCAFAVTITLLGDWLIVRLLTEEYAGNTAIIAMLAFGLVARVPGFVASRGLFVLDRADLELLNNIGPVLVLLVLGVTLTGRYGASGAAFSLLIAQLLGSATRVWFFARCTRSTSEDERSPYHRAPEVLT